MDGRLDPKSAAIYFCPHIFKVVPYYTVLDIMTATYALQVELTKEKIASMPQDVDDQKSTFSDKDIWNHYLYQVLS